MDQGQLDLVKGHQWAMDAKFCTAGCWPVLGCLAAGLPGDFLLFAAGSTHEQLHGLQMHLEGMRPSLSLRDTVNGANAN